jgi:ribose transport system ATP-binding protein
VATVFQELTVLPHTTVAQTLLLGREPRGSLAMVPRKKVSQLAAEALAEWGVGDVATDALVSELPLGVRQKVNIVAALMRRPRVLVLDEATSALGPEDVSWLFAKARDIGDAGGTVLIITHRLDEIMRICEQVTILRDGKVVATQEVAATSRDDMVRAMIGRTIEETRTRQHIPQTGLTPRLSVRGLAGAGFRDVTFDVAPGQIVGAAGLQGQGQRELFLALFGALRHQGVVAVDGKPVRLRSPRAAISAGICLVPEDRKTEGLVLDLPGRENVSLPVLRTLTRVGLIRLGAESRMAGGLMDRLSVSRSALFRLASEFSGGNQQKLLFAKWLARQAGTYLFYDPTRGVDIGTKEETYQLVSELADQGCGIIYYTTEIEELPRLCDPVMVMYGGAVSSVLRGADITHERVLRAMLGPADSSQPTSAPVASGNERVG